MRPYSNNWVMFPVPFGDWSRVYVRKSGLTSVESMLVLARTQFCTSVEMRFYLILLSRLISASADKAVIKSKVIDKRFNFVNSNCVGLTSGKMLNFNPFRKDNSKRQFLWNYLDSCEIEFRKSELELIEKFGHRNCDWTKNLDYCEIVSKKPFIDKLCHPLVFQFIPNEGRMSPPDTLQGYVRVENNSYENFEIAGEQLELLLGKGKDVSSSNTRSTLWEFGTASVRATIFPPDLNNISLSRHDKIQGSKTECVIEIHPAYYPSPTEAELIALSNFVRISSGGRPPSFDGRHFVSDTIREHAPLNKLKHVGYGVDSSKEYFIRFRNSTTLDIFPTNQIIDVTYSQIRPAKGPGGIYVGLNYRISDKPASKRSHITLIEERYVTNLHRNTAKKISKFLGVALKETNSDDY